MKNYFERLSKVYVSKWIILSLDLAIVLANFFISNLLYFGVNKRPEFSDFEGLPIIAIISLISFFCLSSYECVIRHSGINDILRIIFASIFIHFLSVTSFFIGENSANFFIASASVILWMHFALNVTFLVFSRMAIKFVYGIFSKIYLNKKRTTNILIYGAGAAGFNLLNTIKSDPDSKLSVAAFVDDDISKKGKIINGVRVIYSNKINEDFIKRHSIKEVIICIPSIDSKGLSNIFSNLEKLPIKLKRIPPVQSWINNELSISQVKEVQIEDLLDRNVITVKNAKVIQGINNKTALITGAAGSIGSEIVRQLTKYDYKNLILVDQAESALYDVQQELKRNKFENITCIVADIRDYSRMERVFRKHKPNLVFHAAAYKHVPLMENNPCEAVNVNILGTKKIADLSNRYGVEKFVLVSTDKAVNPTNVMGATKRVAEMYMKYIQKNSSTKYITTRFGNVLGSNGSVIPLFKKQIEQKGPLTVTHKGVTRYFMTIPEASRLVIEAGIMGNGGEIYLFDMGEPVKIYDLAKKMIRLSGLQYPNDIDIKIVGLRPGEKLYEELLAQKEETQQTYNKKILISKHEDIDYVYFKNKFEDLTVANLLDQDELVVKNIKEIVPEFKSKNSIYEKFDLTEEKEISL